MRRAEPGEEGEAAIETVIMKLKELGYLSDERFAADYTRLRKENEKYGKRRVQQGLMQKGIAQELTQSTLRRRMTRWTRWRWRRSMLRGKG